jgi:hypothetical protein
MSSYLSPCDSHGDCVVVYSGRHCPVCELQKERDEFEEEVNSLKGEVDNLKDNVSDLESQVN